MGAVIAKIFQRWFRKDGENIAAAGEAAAGASANTESRHVADYVFSTNPAAARKASEIVSGTEGGMLWGDAGDDWLAGGAGDDTLWGEAGDDFLFGFAGDDTLFGGAGADTLFGGTGNDTFRFDVGDGRDRVRDFADGDIIRFERVRFRYDDLDIRQDGDDTVIAYGGGEDRITLEGVQASSLDANDVEFTGITQEGAQEGVDVVVIMIAVGCVVACLTLIGWDLFWRRR